MFEWKPEYSVDIPAIDAQHQQLFALAAELHLARAQGKAKAAVERSITSLLDYTRSHFVEEERLMREFGYPGADAHKAEHDHLTAQVLDFQERLSRHEAGLTLDLIQFFKNRLERHIKFSDRKYAVHIRGKTAA